MILDDIEAEVNEQLKDGEKVFTILLSQIDNIYADCKNKKDQALYAIYKDILYRYIREKKRAHKLKKRNHFYYIEGDNGVKIYYNSPLTPIGYLKQELREARQKLISSGLDYKHIHPSNWHG